MSSETKNSLLGAIAALIIVGGFWGGVMYLATPTKEEKYENLKRYLEDSYIEHVEWTYEMAKKWVHNYHNNIYDVSIDYNEDGRVTQMELDKALNDVMGGWKSMKQMHEEKLLKSR